MGQTQLMQIIVCSKYMPYVLVDRGWLGFCYIRTGLRMMDVVMDRWLTEMKFTFHFSRRETLDTELSWHILPGQDGNIRDHIHDGGWGRGSRTWCGRQWTLWRGHGLSVPSGDWPGDSGPGPAQPTGGNAHRHENTHISISSFYWIMCSIKFPFLGFIVNSFLFI